MARRYQAIYDIMAQTPGWNNIEARLTKFFEGTPPARLLDAERKAAWETLTPDEQRDPIKVWAWVDKAMSPKLDPYLAPSTPLERWSPPDYSGGYSARQQFPISQAIPMPNLSYWERPARPSIWTDWARMRF